MSSKLTDLAWGYRTNKSEDKLLLLALAEVADNKGNFNTSVSELNEMTGMQDGVISTILRHFLSKPTALIALHQREKNNKSEYFSGTLQLEKNVAKSQSEFAENQFDLLAQAQLQHDRLNSSKKSNKAKLNRSQRAQVAPLNPSAKDKQYSVLEIHMEKIPDWAEGVMFKSGVHKRKEIWDSFVSDVHATGERIFTLAQLTNRLHQKIQYYKELSFSNINQNAPSRPVRQSALSIFEEKVQNYLSEDDGQDD